MSRDFSSEGPSEETKEGVPVILPKKRSFLITDVEM